MKRQIDLVIERRGNSAYILTTLRRLPAISSGQQLRLRGAVEVTISEQEKDSHGS
jgi:hypothetical protein